MNTPQLTVKTGLGIRSVTVHFEPGTQAQAFDLLNLVLPGLRELDRRVRNAADILTPDDPGVE